MNFYRDTQSTSESFKQDEGLWQKLVPTAIKAAEDAGFTVRQPLRVSQHWERAERSGCRLVHTYVQVVQGAEVDED